MKTLHSTMRFLKKMDLFSSKIIFRLAAITSIIFLSGVTITFTYKAYIETIQFFKFPQHIDAFLLKKYISYTISSAVGIATAIQSGPVIWDKMSYWGQEIDNKLIYLFTRKIYFLHEAEKLIKETRKIIDQINMEIQHFQFSLIQDQNKIDDLEIKKQHLNTINGKHVTSVVKKCQKIRDLLHNNEAHDSKNKKKKQEYEENFNSLISKVAYCCRYISHLKSEIHKKT